MGYLFSQLMIEYYRHSLSLRFYLFLSMYIISIIYDFFYLFNAEKQRKGFFLPLSIICVNQIHIYNFSCSCLYVIHCTDPRHLVGAFEFLRYAFFSAKCQTWKSSVSQRTLLKIVLYSYLNGIILHVSWSLTVKGILILCFS